MQKNPEKTEINLQCTTGTSNKFYNLLVIKDKGELKGEYWVLTTQWGRIGTEGQTKAVGSWKAYKTAKRCMDMIVAQKKAKGYVVVEQNTILDVEKLERAKIDPSLQRFIDILKG